MASHRWSSAMTKMKLGLRSAACAMADQASKPVKMNCCSEGKP